VLAVFTIPCIVAEPPLKAPPVFEIVRVGVAAWFDMPDALPFHGPDPIGALKGVPSKEPPTVPLLGWEVKSRFWTGMVVENTGNENRLRHIPRMAGLQ
jgi:hypothetical protein